MGTRKILWPSLILAVGMVLAGCTSTSTPAASTVVNSRAAEPAGSWLYANGDLGNTRDAAGATISSANVTGLQQAWTFKLPASLVTSGPGFGSLAATPIVAHGVVYLQDLGNNVYALALATGKLQWEYQVSSKIVGGGPNGVALAGGVLYGDTASTVFALSATTGKTIWADQDLLSDDQGTFGIQPLVANGRVYLASSIGTGPTGGILLALNAATGQLAWKFNTVVPARNGAATPYGSGGAWETPLPGSDGSVTFGTGNPYQSAAEAIARPSPWLYTDSVVNLDAATGKLRWYYQGVTNDFMDHDMQTSPIAATIDGQPAVIGSGKMGVVYAMNASTGKLLWKTPVGAHSTSDSYPLEAMEHKLTLTAPYTILPGSLGGVLSNLALAGNTVYVATVDQRFTLTKMSYPLGGKDGRGAGEIEALNLTTGKVEWDTKVPAYPLGAATVSNDLLFTTLYTGVLIALDRTTGAVVYQHKLPTSANAPIAIAGNSILVPAGGPNLWGPKGGSPQLVVYTVH
ncbi:MAG: PQQ-binding-like beta-propeller repeat protein [Actinomycetota bacterium]|nr:PQQ-binding-like beta-propeller repeat protein [Actinomycetota bacterium]